MQKNMTSAVRGVAQMPSSFKFIAYLITINWKFVVMKLRERRFC